MTATASKPATTPAFTLVPVELQHEIEQFLYAEADLQDAWRIDEWYALMADDLEYWAPTRLNRTQRELDKEISDHKGSAFFDEDHRLLGQRIARMHTGFSWAEDPPSRIRHLITNVRISLTDNPDEYAVESSFYLFRTRMERDMDRFVGKRYDLLRRADNGYGFEIARRKILLDMATLLAKNISIFF